MVKVNLYNTVSRKKEEFKPNKPGEVGIYSCGPTVYWNQHIGHMYAYVQWDTLVRFFEYIGYKTKWVMNITDVGHLTSDGDTGDDKMEKGAKREPPTVWEIAKKYEKQFLDSMDMLNIKRPDVLCRVTEHIEEQIDLIKKIEKNGFTYKTKTGLVYDTSKFADYSKFANLKLDEMESGARVKVDPEKKKAWDFLLWVTNQPDHIMQWDSPWGRGFPGWHIECTAMSCKYLGQNFDIHTGGIEHIGVHHTNEIAQGYGAFGKQTANYWLHNAWLTIDDTKMSKSGGTMYTVTDLLEKGYDPKVLRYLILTSSYRKGLDFTFRSLKVAETSLIKLRKLVREMNGGGQVVDSYKDKFVEFLADDLSTPQALALVWKLVKDKDVSDIDKKTTLLDFDRVLGLDLEKKIKLEVPGEVTDLAEERKIAKMNKNWQEADKIRQTIEDRGFVVEDLPENSYRIVVKR
jgi:cysteinyl-tRNA synthetase